MSYQVAHIAIAVKSLSETIRQVETIFGVKASPVEEVSTQKVRLQFVSIGGVKLEFLEPTTEDSPISKFIEKRGGGIHHIAYKTENLKAQLSRLKAAGIPLIHENPVAGAENCQIAFLHPKALSGVLVELIEGSGEH